MPRSTGLDTAQPTDDDGPLELPFEWDLDRPPITFEEFRARALKENPFQSDEEIDEFIAWIHAERRRYLA